ncbi:paraquat-inducible protein A [Roseivivax marinus]|uniref:Paraquat-inducible protein A n=1 Tax=Roseivivax marinus TaxID=1379903 RepID=W4HQM2_9RHOB|nr:paraquat-inducible protein A [Roseivivax marinus]ETW14728.1 paraquat-inducible protein A [Roseivivax marinus]
MTTGRRLRLMAIGVLALLYPVAWTAPLLRAGVLPFFGMSEISVLSGLSVLWQSDRALALLVALFAVIAPYAKLAGMAWLTLRPAPAVVCRAVHVVGRLAMADVFLVALYVVIAKGVGVGRVETAWGLYLFSFCVLAALALSPLQKQSPD